MAFRNFSKRSSEIELMDSQSVSFAEFNNCLRHLEWINIFTLAYLPTYFWLKKVIAKNSNQKKISIFDVGSGGGDMLRKILKWGKGSKIKFRLTGIDINPWSKKSAEEFTPKTALIKFETADIFTLSAEQKPDFIISSLFTHHLDNDSLIKFIRWMDGHATCGWFINDLHRHFIPYYFIKWVTYLLPVNRLVKNDAAVSVARAFRAQELWRLLDEAGIARERVKISWFFPFRYSVTCKKL
jgi:2-polyprenyl-3-methyl-5-hydroxy-6-metoxy-1,4-benzoquinol methylase